MYATPRRSSVGGSEWCIHASEVGRQVDAKWNSSAERPFHVGQSAVILTTPLHTMNLTHWQRSTHVIGCAAAVFAPLESDHHGAYRIAAKPVSSRKMSHWKESHV